MKDSSIFVNKILRSHNLDNLNINESDFNLILCFIF